MQHVSYAGGGGGEVRCYGWGGGGKGGVMGG